MLALKPMLSRGPVFGHSFIDIQAMFKSEHPYLSNAQCARALVQNDVDAVARFTTAVVHTRNHIGRSIN